VGHNVAGPEEDGVHKELLAQARAAEEALACDPRNTRAMLQAAEACLRADLKDRALAHASAAAEAAPGNYRVIRTLSGIQGAVGLRDGAIHTAREAVEMAPGEMEARMHLSGLLMGAALFREAAHHLTVLCASQSATAVAWRMLSTALHQTGRTERALEATGHAIELAPNQIEYRLHRASLLESRGRYGNALGELATAAEQSPDDARVAHAQSCIHKVLGNLSAALADAERAVTLDPGNTQFKAHRDHVARLIGIVVSQTNPTALLAEPPSVPPRRRTHPSRKPRAPKGIGSSLASRWQVIYAIMLREMRTRFARSRLGYFWAIMEPASHLLTLGSAFRILNNHPPPVGDSLFLYYVTGLLPYLMFNHVSSVVMHSLSGSSPVMLLPKVRTTDVVWGHGLLQFATEALTFALVFSVAAVLGVQGMPADPLICIMATLSVFAFAMGVGMFNMVVRRYSHSWETWFQSVVRLMYFASGIYYSPIAMPDWVRDILVWSPMLQGIEWFRSGFYRQYEPHWLDVGYLLACVAGTLLLGLVMERTDSKRARIGA
jgi:ABC-type polysaccharide/polyol phosphate export permease